MTATAARPGWRLASAGRWTAGLTLVAMVSGAVPVLVTELTAQLTAVMLRAVDVPVTRVAAVLSHSRGFSCEIGIACTALLPALLLAGGLAAWRARPVVVVFGILFMALVNQLRLVGLVWVGVNAPAEFELAHDVVGPLLLVLGGVGFVALWRRLART